MSDTSSSGQSIFTNRLGGWAQRYQDKQNARLDSFGLQNLASGKGLTQQDVVKFSSNPYISREIDKQISKIKFLDKLDNNPYVQAIRSSGVLDTIVGDGSIDSMLSGGIPPTKNTERVWTFLDENGSKCVPFNVFISMSVKCDAKTTTSPVEQGSFVSYNKTQAPIQINCSLGFRGSPDELLNAITILLEMVNGVNLISVVTPDHEYKNMTIEKMSYNRSADAGIDLIIVDCSLIEVRQVKAETSNARINSRQQRGQVQAKQTSMLSLISGK